jgi:PST family polysaccharide transporter
MNQITTYLNKITQFLLNNDGSLKKKVIRSGFWVGLSSIVINALSFIRSIILARLLTPEIFGLMGICLMITRGVELSTETGFSAALIHRQKNYEEAKDTAFTLMILRGFILAIVAFLIAPLVANYYERNVIDVIIKIIAISFIIKGFHNINIVGLKKELDFKRLTYLEQSMTIINFVVVVSLAYLLRNVWALVIGQIIASFMGVILSYIIIPGRPHIRFNKKIAKELFTYGKFITGLTVVIYITTEIDNAFVGKMLGMENLGYYVLAYTLANLPATHISKLISKVMFPAYSKLQNDLPALREVYLKVLKLVATITIPAAAGIAVLAPEIILVVYGEKWVPAVSALRILSIFGCIRALSSINGYLYNAIGKPNITFYMNMVKLVIILLIIYPLIKNYNILGASIAVTVPITAMFFVGIFIFRSIIGLEINKVIYPLFITSFFSFIMVIVLLYLRQFVVNINVYSLGILIFLGMATYALLNFRGIVNFIKKWSLSEL